MQALYKGVRGHLIYDNSRSIVLYKFTREPMSQLQIDGESFESFYRRTKGITLNNLHWPAIRAEGSQNNLFPIQCVQIMPNQRVPLEKMSETISRALLEVSDGEGLGAADCVGIKASQLHLRPTRLTPTIAI